MPSGRSGRGIPTFVARVPDYVTRADWDLDLARLVAAFEPDLVVSAGFMKVLGPAVLGGHRVVNTHPALLPSFPGAHGVRDAMAHGVKVTGCTCHWVDAGVDTGPIIDQRAVRVEDDDTVETLHERIKVVEREMLVDVVRRLAADRSWRRPAPRAGSGAATRDRRRADRLAPVATDPADLTPAALDFMSERHLATFTTLRRDGSPHVVPVGFTWDAEARVARVIAEPGQRQGRRRPGQVAARR